MGLKADGTVVSTGSNAFDQSDLRDWKDIVAISAGDNFVVGLKADGTVAFVGDTTFQQDYVKAWDNIIEIDAGSYHTVGLRADGAVLVAGGEIDSESGDRDEFYPEEYGHFEDQGDVELWNRMRMIEAEMHNTAGLWVDDTVKYVGHPLSGQDKATEWKGIVNVGMSGYVVYGQSVHGYLYNTRNTNVVEGWHDVVYLAASNMCVLGVQRDGTVLYAEAEVREKDRYGFDEMIEDIAEWESIGLSEDSEVFEF